MLKLHNTLSGKTEEFVPREDGKVSMYNCGPTVYGVQHIGNLSMFVFTDILRRTLDSQGFVVKQVINFTDFGHLTGENNGTPDEGEDKMAKGLRAEGLEQTLPNMKILATKFASIFLRDLSALGVDTGRITFPYASEYIEDQINLIKTLEEKGFAYKTSDGLYYDTAKFPHYGELGNVQKKSGDAEARIEANPEKRNPQDFALWKFNEKIGWLSPWGRGFPGWHIECSAMIMNILGPQIDIHTGGIEHISIHHNNEIAQTEAATGLRPFSKFWLHRAHLQINNSKIAKSDGNVVYLSEIEEKGYSPIALRYHLLTSHYRTATNFTWEALEASNEAYLKLLRTVRSFPKAGEVNKNYFERFKVFIEDDLNTPQALALIWELLKDVSVSPESKRATILIFDRVLGLNLEHANIPETHTNITSLPIEIRELIDTRETARKNKDFATSDTLRDELKQKGYIVEDKPDGPQISRL